MITGSIARRYARALFSLAVEKRSVEAWNQSLVALARGRRGLAGAQATCCRTRPTRASSAARWWSRLAAAMQLDAEPANLLYLMGDRNRLGALSGIVAAFRELADVELGRLRAKVTSAVPLDDASVAAIAAKLAASTQKKVLVERVVDPAILGGVVAQVGSLVYDGSLRTQLEDLRKHLEAVAPPDRTSRRQIAMDIRADEISRIIRDQIKDYGKKVDVAETGTVLSQADGVARIYGLTGAAAGELLDFGHGISGLVLNLEDDNVGAAIMGAYEHIREGDAGQADRPHRRGAGGRGAARPRGRRPRQPHRRPRAHQRQAHPQDRDQGARHRPAQVGARADADRPQGHRRPGADRPRPARAHHRRPPDRQDRRRHRHHHQQQGAGRSTASTSPSARSSPPWPGWSRR